MKFDVFDKANRQYESVELKTMDEFVAFCIERDTNVYVAVDRDSDPPIIMLDTQPPEEPSPPKRPNLRAL